jgi:hypothetical protein
LLDGEWCHSLKLLDAAIRRRRAWCCPRAELFHNPNTFCTVALRRSLSSGVLAIVLRAAAPRPDATVDLEGHGRSVESNAEIGLPHLLERRVVEGRHGPVRQIRPPAVARVPLTVGYGRWAFFLIAPVMGSTAVKLLSSRSATCLPPFPAGWTARVKPLGMTSPCLTARNNQCPALRVGRWHVLGATHGGPAPAGAWARLRRRRRGVSLSRKPFVISGRRQQRNDLR